MRPKSFRMCYLHGALCVAILRVAVAVAACVLVVAPLGIVVLVLLVILVVAVTVHLAVFNWLYTAPYREQNQM